AHDRPRTRAPVADARPTPRRATRGRLRGVGHARDAGALPPPVLDDGLERVRREPTGEAPRARRRARRRPGRAAHRDRPLRARAHLRPRHGPPAALLQPAALLHRTTERWLPHAIRARAPLHRGLPTAGPAPERAPRPA